MNALAARPVNFAPKHLFGIDVIDNAWGGLYRGGSYLVYGRAASGRGLLTLMFAHTGSALGESTLFISPDRHKDLMIQAASIGFNLKEAHEAGDVRLVRVPPLLDLQSMGDDGVSRALWDLVTLIRQHRPTRLVMNDFMPFVAFRSYDRFRTEFIQFLEQIDSLDTTTILVMPEPANEQSGRVIEFMASQMTGSIRIELGDQSVPTTMRRISLIPHIGHIKREVVDYWDLENLSVPSRTGQQPKESVPPQETAESEPEGFIFEPSSIQGPQAGFGLNFDPDADVREPAPPPSFPSEPEPPSASIEEVFHLDAGIASDSVDELPEAASESEEAANPFGNQPQPSSFQAPPPPQPPVSQSSTFPSSSFQAPPPPQPPVSEESLSQPPPPAPVHVHMPTSMSVPDQPSPSLQGSGSAQDQSSPGRPEDFSAASDDAAVFADRESFEHKLQEVFTRRDSGQPFLLLALKMEQGRQAERPIDFDFLTDLVRAELGPTDGILAVAEIERMVVLLQETPADVAQTFFSGLRDRLSIVSPKQSDGLLQSVSAIVVPDGRPFKGASEFLAYALDGA